MSNFCKLGYNIDFEKHILDRLCHVCVEENCIESASYNPCGDCNSEICDGCYCEDFHEQEAEEGE